MDDRIKLKLFLYGIISAITYIYLILTPNPGISIPLFFLIQFVCVYLILRNKKDMKNIKGMLVMVPIFIISLNHFISANNIWRTTNFFAIVFLYSAMFLMLNGNLNFKAINFKSFLCAFANIFEPIINFIVPVRWIAEKSKNREKNLLIRRITIGIAISIPCVFFLIMMLSSADMVFYNNFVSFNEWIADLLNFIYLFKLIIGTFVGLYLLGHLYSVFSGEDSTVVKITSENTGSAKQINGDVIVLNILLVSILTIYSIFIAIQFKYLFSSGALPYGLNYADYARRGFFELVFLSVLNIALILLVTYLLNTKIYVEKNKWALFTKLMLIYLCILTGILLVSSYYRMSLYDSAYGFTRLRILVYLFLIFEAVGLAATLIYIMKHNFNILAVYTAIGLAFYLSLNLIKIDDIIAERNIDMYFAGQTESLDMEYLMTLSADAAPQIMRLLDKNVEFVTRNNARIYLEGINELYGNMEYNWQSYNLSVEKTKELLLINSNKLSFNYE